MNYNIVAMYIGSNKGADICYTFLNDRAESGQFGNCGHTTTAFIPCASRYVYIAHMCCTLAIRLGMSMIVFEEHYGL